MEELVKFVLILLICMFAEGRFPQDKDFLNEEAKLRDKLFFSGRHNTDLRPRADKNEAVDVKMTFHPSYLEEVDERKEIMTVRGWSVFIWKDDSIHWNPDDYKGIKSLAVADFLIWKPDITVYNNAEASDITAFDSSLALVKHTGEIHWVPFTTFRFICGLDFTSFPFDKHNCLLKLGSWTHSGFEINLHSGNATEVSTDEMYKHQQWQIYKTKVETVKKYYSCCEEPYLTVNLNFFISRKAPYYGYVLLIPSIMIMLLILSVFWLPPNAGNEKMILAGFNTICLTILLAHLHCVVPKSTGNIPRIVFLNGTAIVMSMLSIVLSIVTMGLSRLSPPAPSVLRPLITGISNKLFCLGPSRIGIPVDAKLLTSGSVEINVSEEDAHSVVDHSEKDDDWLLVASAVDRILFWLYCICFLAILCVSFQG